MCTIGHKLYFCNLGDKCYRDSKSTFLIPRTCLSPWWFPSQPPSSHLPSLSLKNACTLRTAISSPYNYLQKRKIRNAALLAKVVHWAGAKPFWYHSHMVALLKHGYCSCLSTLSLPPASTLFHCPLPCKAFQWTHIHLFYKPSSSAYLHIVLFCSGNAKLKRLMSILHAWDLYKQGLPVTSVLATSISTPCFPPPSAGDWDQGFMHTIWTFYHWATSPAKMFYVFLWEGCL